MLCPIMARPYLHKYECNGSEEGETRMHEIGCYGNECALWSEGKNACSLKRDYD